MTENKVLASVEGKEITQEIVMKFLNDLGPEMAMQFQSPEGMKRVVDELINQEILYLDAVDNKVDEDPDFLKELDKLKEGLLKQYAVNKLIGNTSVSEEEVQTHYNENKEMFIKPETVQGRHILVETEDKANDVINEIKAGLSFEDAATKYSSCQSKIDGGRLGEFGRGQMVPEFDTAAFELEVDVLSEPVKTQFGYHIILITAKNEEGISSFDEVKEQLSRHLLGVKQQDLYIKETNKLKEKYNVVINM